MSNFEKEMIEEVRKKDSSYKDMRFLGIALFAQKGNGLYDLYMPLYDHEYSDSPYRYFSKPFFVCSNIEDWKLLEDIDWRDNDAAFFIKVRENEDTGFWAPIFPSYFCFYLTEERAKGRFNSLPRFRFDGNSSLTVLDDFRYLQTIHSCYCYIFSIDDKTYLMRNDSGSAFSNDMNVHVQLLKNPIFPVPSDDYFLEDDGTQKCIYRSYNYAPIFGPAKNIIRLSGEEYKSSDDSAVYVSQDENGDFLGIFNVGEKDTHYNVVFEQPARQLRFLTQFVDKIVYNSYQSRTTIIDFWGVTYLGGKKDVIVRAYGDGRFSFDVDYDKLSF